MKARERRTGITLVHTGDGKGKSSSAFGGSFALPVPYESLSHPAYKRQVEDRREPRSRKVRQYRVARPWRRVYLEHKNPEQDRETSHSIWAFSQEKIRSQTFDLVVLDEINYCCGWRNRLG